ncbi:MAG: hypothetical protein IJA10_07135 [Lachnospiraceae bacterium]|nr:hypothetical protein [Lachnospiraceae bacterium]
MIRPIDMQMSINRTESVSQIQQQQNQRAVQEHMQFGQQVEKEVKKQQEIVIKKDSASFNEYKYDAKEKGNNEYQKREKKNQKKEKKTEDKSEIKENSSSHDSSQVERVNFDIKV